MAWFAAVSRVTPPLPRAAVRRALMTFRRRVLPSGLFALSVLGVLAVVIGLAAAAYPDWIPTSALVIPIILGGFLLSLRNLVLLSSLTAVSLVYQVVVDYDDLAPGAVVVVVAITVMMALAARSRARVGVPPTRGDAMLVDLRDRLQAQGEMPPLPDGWHADVVLRSAGGASFAGDFLVAQRSFDGRLLEVALVDVSGKGVGAGTRALLLSGAFGGLLGSLSPEEFLPAANSYLLRQDWPEGFATAVHLAIDLVTGEFEVRSAGHPPAAQFEAGSGTWRVCEAHGPLLGVMEPAAFLAEKGLLGSGDVVLLYTDGLVEVPGRDISLGLDRLLGHAERTVTGGFRHGARGIVDSVGHGAADDRALVMLWRS